MLKDLFKGSAIYGMAPFVPRILSIFLLPILTKYLTSTDYGIIASITAITFAIQALQDLGLSVLLTNYFYKSRCQYKIFWREIYGFLSLWLICYAIIQAILLYIFIPDEADSNRWLIILLSNFSTVLFGPTAIIGSMYYQLTLNPTPVAARMVITGVITILTNYVCVVVFRWGYMGAYVGSFAGTFITNASYWPVINKKLGLSPIYNFKRKTIINALKVSIPTIPHYYTVYLMNSSNVAAMNFYKKSQAEIGCLSMAQSFTSMFEALINAVNKVFSPMTFDYIRDEKSKEMKRLLYTYIIIAFTATSFYSLWCREIYDLLISNDEIAATYKYSIVLVMALNYRPLYVYSSGYFFYHENTFQLLGITFLAGIISCLFYFLMIPFLGVYAALLGFYFGCLYMGYIGYSYNSYRQKTIFNFKWYRFLILQVLLTFLVYYMVDLPVLMKVFLSVFFLSAILFCFIKVNGYAKYNF